MRKIIILAALLLSSCIKTTIPGSDVELCYDHCKDRKGIRYLLIVDGPKCICGDRSEIWLKYLREKAEKDGRE